MIKEEEVGYENLHVALGQLATDVWTSWTESTRFHGFLSFHRKKWPMYQEWIGEQFIG